MYVVIKADGPLPRQTGRGACMGDRNRYVPASGAVPAELFASAVRTSRMKEETTK